MKTITVVDEKTNNTPVITSSPLEIAQNFLSNGGDIANLEKLLILQEKYDAMQAKKEYHAAMAAFKANPPKIIKNKEVAFEQKRREKEAKKLIKYRHANLGLVSEKISKALSVHGLSATWKTNQNDLIEVTCIITHAAGYSESTTLKAAPDSSGGKNAIQAIGSTVSYLERYTILALTGLATHDQDNDGRPPAPVKLISEKQASELTDLMNSIKNFDEKAFLKWIKKDSIELILDTEYAKVKAALIAKMKQGEK